MISGQMTAAEIVQTYKADVDSLIQYIPWLETKRGAVVASVYEDDQLRGHSIPFPVYDATLMNLVKTAEKTGLMNRNYAYIYSRNSIKTLADEKRMIEHATIRDMDILAGILSKYILGGRTKGRLWSEAVENGIYLDILLKCKEVLSFWDKPLA